MSEGFVLLGEIREACRKFRMEKNLEEKDVVIELSIHAGCLIEQIPNNEIGGLSRELFDIGIEEYLKKKGLYKMKAVINNQLDAENKPFNLRTRTEKERTASAIS